MGVIDLDLPIASALALLERPVRMSRNAAMIEWRGLQKAGVEAGCGTVVRLCWNARWNPSKVLPRLAQSNM